MQISWSGYGCFRLQESNVSVIFDPTVPESNFKLRKTSAELLLLSHPRTKDDLACIGEGTFIIDTPGEYEVKGVFVNGLGYNHASVIYWLDIGGVTVAWIGPVKAKDLPAPILEKIEGVDVLILPVGGGGMMTPKEAAAMINQIEPSIIIPAYTKISGSKGLEAVEPFLKEYGAKHETTDKLKITKKDVTTEDTRVVVLTV
ncbi:MAG: MBL fold metallo-hydrolase [Candidatus Komeilibacteria bacterium]